MGWLSNIFKESTEAEAPSPSTSFHDLDGHPVPLTLQGSDLRAARELVKDAATQTAVVYGIPAHWLAYEVVTIADDEKAFFQLQVTLQYWDDYFSSHTYAFERAVLKRIRDEDLPVGRAVRAVLWRTSPDAGCPYDDLPEPQAWTSEAIKQRGEANDRVRREMRNSARGPAGSALGPLGNISMAAGAAAAAIVPGAVLPASAAPLPDLDLGIDDERTGDSTIPVTFDHLQEPSDFGKTRPTAEHDFEVTLSDDFQSTHGLQPVPNKA
jgi:hypothetical protein